MEPLIFIKDHIATIIHEPSTKPKGLIIICPGYLDSKDHEHIIKLAQDLASVGYTAVRFDPTGIWDSKKTIEQYTIPQQLQDIQDIIDYMFKERTYNDVIVGGHSLGGFVALLYSSTHLLVTKAFAIMSPYTLSRNINIKKTLKWKNSGVRVSLRDVPGKNEKKEFRVPFSNFEDASKYNLLEIAPNFKIPILLIAGELDDTILPENIEQLYAKLNGPKKLITLKGVGHNYRRNQEQINLVDNEVINFIVNSK